MILYGDNYDEASKRAEEIAKEKEAICLTMTLMLSLAKACRDGDITIIKRH